MLKCGSKVLWGVKNPERFMICNQLHTFSGVFGANHSYWLKKVYKKVFDKLKNEKKIYKSIIYHILGIFILPLFFYSVIQVIYGS